MSTLLTSPSRVTRTLAVAFALVTVAGAESLLTPTAIPLDSLAAFKSPPAAWQIAGGVGGDPRTQKNILPLPGTGVLVNNPTEATRGLLLTTWEHGDAEIDLDFLMTPASNSGLFLMGRYEVQLFDSWGAKTPTSADSGGIFKRWDESRGAGHEGFEGSAPRANASRAPGLWQHLHVEFQAPRFDTAGKKTANARFIKVVLNDFVVQENVEVTGPTRAAPFTDEVAIAPLVIQGNHGAIAMRAIAVKNFNPAATPVRVEDLAYKLYSSDSGKGGRYDSVPPKREGKPEAFAADSVEKSGRFALVFTGTLVIPRDGAYSFTPGGNGSVGLVIDGQSAIEPYDHGGEPVECNLTAGRHSFRLDYIHGPYGKVGFTLAAEGPGLARHLLTAPDAPSPESKRNDTKPRTLIITPPADRVRLQRSFVPFDPKKRLYAINVGTPAGLHYSYDFETGAILRVWRGEFLDTFEMWDGRGENQLAKPAGPSLTLIDKPVLALLERYSNDWPNEPDAMWSSQGYKLEPDGQPTFLFKLSTLSATDRIAPLAASHGLTRTLVVTGKTTSWESWILLAEADHISPQPGGHGYIIGDRSYYLDLPADSAVRPLLRTRNGRQQLLVPISGSTLGKPIVYSLVW
jgi:hypothetical protein